MHTTRNVFVWTTLALSLAACGQQAAQPTATAPSAAVIRAAATDYTNGVTVSGSTATIWFKSNVSTSWVDVHYSLNGGGQQNLRMTYNSAAGRYEQNVTVASGNTLTYSFTYNNGTPAYDTPSFSYTVGSGTTTGGGTSSGAIGGIAASSIPAPTGSGVMSMKIMNGTNGAYADNNIYWGVLGINPANGKWSYLDLGGNLQPMSAALNDASGHLTKNAVNYANIYHRISDAGWASLPRITAGRMYLCVGSPCYIKTFDNGFAGPNVDNGSDPNLNVYFDFIEFTVDATGYHGNVTRVDGFGFPLEHRLVSKSGYDRTVGEPETETRAGIFNEYKAEVPGAFTSLATVQAPYRIVAPIHGDFRAGGPQGTYFDGYVNSVWPAGSTKPTTQNVLLCNGPLAQTSGACAGLNRHVYANQSTWNTVSSYYQAAPANYYAQFWHRHGLGGLAYGFAYDDYNQQAAYLEVGDPKGLIIRVGW